MKIKIPFFLNTGEPGEPIVLEMDEKLKSNPVLITQAIHVEANRRQIKAGLTKTRGNVRGGGRKPWKQKGTGRARAGSNRSPLWRGGGITFGPQTEKKTLEIPKKMKEKAFLTLVAHKAGENELAVIENIKIKDQKTKAAQAVLLKIAPAKRSILALDDSEVPDTIAWRNLPLVEIKKQSDITLGDLNTKKEIIFSQKAFDPIKNKLQK